MIQFLIHMFKWPQNHSIYWAIEYTRAAYQALGQLVAYHHIARGANYIADDTAR